VIRTATADGPTPSIHAGLSANTVAMIENASVAGTVGPSGILYVAPASRSRPVGLPMMIGSIVFLVLMIAALQLMGDALVFATAPKSPAHGTSLSR